MQLPQHAFFFSGYCKHTPGSLCGLGCLPGYRLASGDSYRECRSDGTWTGQQPKCEGKVSEGMVHLFTSVFS